MLHYDVVVIGSGPGRRERRHRGRLRRQEGGARREGGGARAAPRANTGTIPSKALRETALAIQQARSRDAHGIELAGLRHRDGPRADGPPRPRHRARALAHPRRAEPRRRRAVPRHRELRRPAHHPGQDPRRRRRFQELARRRHPARHRHPPVPPAAVHDRQRPGLRLGLDPHARPRAALARDPGRRRGRLRVRLALRRARRARVAHRLEGAAAALARRRAVARACRTSSRWRGSTCTSRSARRSSSRASATCSSRSPTARASWPRRCSSPPGASATSRRLNLPAAGLTADGQGAPRGERALPDLGAAHLRGGRPRRLPDARLGLDGAGARRDEPRLRRSRGASSPGSPAGRHLHHPRGLVGRRDRGVARARRGAPYVVGQGEPRRQRAREPHRRGGRVPEAPRRRRRTARSSASTASARTPPSSSTSARR